MTQMIRDAQIHDKELSHTLLSSYSHLYMPTYLLCHCNDSAYKVALSLSQQLAWSALYILSYWIYDEEEWLLGQFKYNKLQCP